jgi:hypothetical protein
MKQDAIYKEAVGCLGVICVRGEEAFIQIRVSNDSIVVRRIHIECVHVR